MQGNPDRLERYTEATVRSLPPAAEALERYRAAVARFNSAGPNDLGSTLTDRSGGIESVLEDLRELDQIPAAFAGALRVSDAAWQAGPGPALVRFVPDDRRFRADFEARRRNPDATDAEAAELAETILRQDGHRMDRILDRRGVRRVERLDETESAVSAGVTAVRTAVQGIYLVNRTVNLRLERGRRPYQRDYHRNPAVRARYTRAERRLLAASDRRAWRHRIATLERQVDDATAALRTQRPLTTPGRALANSRLGAALTAGGRAWGAFGIGLSVADITQDIEQEDWGGVTSNAAAIIGGGLMLMAFPLAPVGAVLVTGSLIYEYREPLGAVFSDPIDSIRGWAGS